MAKNVQFRSAELLLDIVRKEYRGQERRFDATNNRTGLTIVLVGIYLFLLLKLTPPLGNSRVLVIEGIGRINLSGAIYLLAGLLALIAFYYLLRVLMIDRYRCLELDAEFIAKNGKRMKDRTAMELIHQYREVNQVNGLTLNRKQKNYRIAVGVLSASVVFILFYLVMVFISVM